MMFFAYTLIICLLLPAALIGLYYLVLAGAALVRVRASDRLKPGLQPEAQHRFAMVVPAHNEEAGLADTLQSCLAMVYPRDYFDIFVIADNCSDSTAQVARDHGATVLERTDPERRGKGWALAWGLPHVLAQQPDAVIVLDADCRIDRHTLRVMDRRLAAGADVLQARCIACNPDDSPLSYASCLASVLENDFFFAPKSDLGLAVLLRGTGMVFRRQVLERLPWSAQSIVEDAEYTIRLHEASYRVDFVPEASVYATSPAQSRPLAVQRNRWVGGGLGMFRSHGVKLMLRGLVRGSVTDLDLGWTLLTMLRSLVLAELVATVFLSGVSAVLAPGAFSFGLVGTALSVAALHGMLFGLAACRLGLNAHRLRFLIGAPVAGWQFLWIACQSLLVGPARNWMRTPR